MKAELFVPNARGSEDDAYHFFIAAITAYSGGVLTDERLMGPINVTFNVNGVDLPFAATLRDIYERIDQQADERAEKKALALVTEAGLEPIADILREAEWRIEQAIDAAARRLEEMKC